MKIAEIEEEIKKNGFSEELFSEFQLALKRVPKDLQCQHCYITAYEIAENDISGAIKLTKYGINNCDNSYLDLMRGYLNLGFIYETDKTYKKHCYRSNNIEPDKILRNFKWNLARPKPY